MTNESDTKKLDPRTIKAALEEVSRIYAKVWPLQTFIANNPLSSYEHLNFDRALEVSKAQLGWEERLTDTHFHHWYARNAMTLDAIKAHFKRCSASEWERCFSLPDRDVSLKDILWADLMAGLKSPVSAKPDATLYALLKAMDAPPAASMRGHNRSDWAASIAQGVELLTGKPIVEELDAHTVKWLSAYLDKGQAIWSMPNRHSGLRSAWQSLVVFDNSFSRESRQLLKALLATLPQKPYEALGALLERLEVPAEEVKAYMRWHLGRLPGWVGYMRWYIEQLEQLHVTHDAQRGLLADYLIVRLCTELALCGPLMKKRYHCGAALPQIRECVKTNSLPLKRHSDDSEEMAHRLTRIRQELLLSEGQMRQLLQNAGEDILTALIAFDAAVKSKIFREAMETTFQDQLLGRIKPNVTAPGMTTLDNKPLMQAVFCIDNRSEQFRLHLERCGNIHTLGFAGFFGIPTRLSSYADNFSRDLCPVLMSPRYAIQEIPDDNKINEASHYAESRQSYDFFTLVLKSLMKNAAAMFAYVEAFGLGHAVLMLLNTLVPEKIRHRPFQDVRPELAPKTTTTGRKDGLVEGIALEEQAYYAEAALTMMGLTRDFSPVIVFCGHGTETKNNPYQSSLDCGACGGNAGGASARVLAEVLNNPSVRESLAARNILIPEETVFLAAEHNTVTDEVTFLNLNQYRARLSVPMEPLLSAFQQATRLNRAARTAILPSLAKSSIDQNAVDWSQVRPEWGTAGNAAIVIAPRSLTEKLNLNGRAFLHSYQYQADLQGKSLEAILTGPLVVAQWINAQYLFSSLDNERFGSGSKTIHNVVGRFGVMRGNASDLQVGLPLQTLMADYSLLYHMPLRLTAVVYAPRQTLERIIRRHAVLKNLFNNHWIYLIVLDPESGELLTYCADGAWKPWQSSVPIPDVSDEPLETLAI